MRHRGPPSRVGASVAFQSRLPEDASGQQFFSFLTPGCVFEGAGILIPRGIPSGKLSVRTVTHISLIPVSETSQHALHEVMKRKLLRICGTTLKTLDINQALLHWKPH